MKPVICVRRYEESADRYAVQEVVRDFVMARFSSAFWFCLFREVIDEYFRSFANLTLCFPQKITLQLIVLSTAIFFIFFGLPLLYCLTSVPIVIILIARKS